MDPVVDLLTGGLWLGVLDRRFLVYSLKRNYVLMIMTITLTRTLICHVLRYPQIHMEKPHIYTPSILKIKKSYSIPQFPLFLKRYYLSANNSTPSLCPSLPGGFQSNKSPASVLQAPTSPSGSGSNSTTGAADPSPS